MVDVLVVGMSRTRNYIKGVATGYMATIATVIVGLWLTPFTLRFLDREEYAVFTLASDILMWLGLLDIGITSGLNVQAARLTGCSNQDRLNRLASTAFFTQNAIVGIMILFGCVVAFSFPRFFPVRPELQYTTSTLAVLLVISSAIGFSTRTFSALLVANQQLHVDNLIRLALLAIRTLLTVILLKRGWGLYSLALATLVATITTSVAAVLRTYRLIPGLCIRREYASWETLKSLGSLGVWFSLGGIANVVITCLDRLVAGKLISIESVTTLSLTGRVYALSATLIDQITNTARPMLGQLLGQKKLAEALRVYRHLFKLSTGLAVVAGFSIWAGNEPFVVRWVGAENFGGSILSMAFAVNLIANSWVLPNRAVLSSALILRSQTQSRMVEAALNLGISVLLGHYVGLVGVVLGTAIAAALTSTWYMPLLTAHLFARPWLSFFKQDALPIVLAGIILAPIAWAMECTGRWIGGFAGAIAGGGLTALGGIFILWCVVLDDDLRKSARGIFAGLVSRYWPTVFRFST